MNRAKRNNDKIKDEGVNAFDAKSCGFKSQIPDQAYYLENIFYCVSYHDQPVNNERMDIIKTDYVRILKICF